MSALGIKLPPATAPGGAYVPFARAGNLVFLSGHIAKREGKPWQGRLGENMTLEEGAAAARSVAIDLLGTLREAAGDLDRVHRIVKLLVFVNSTPNFTEQPVVANGASELFLAAFGERGKHARSAVAAPVLPRGTCIEIELVAELE